ncbi:DUF309 domain-containing protein [Frankia sp. AgKG'84/4]
MVVGSVVVGSVVVGSVVVVSSRFVVATGQGHGVHRGAHPSPQLATLVVMTTPPRPGRASERPRDALGRPLPRESDGVAPLNLPPVLAPAAALAAAQHLLDVGRPFQAHEVLEAVWKSAGDEDRDLWRGLTQLAVGITHLARGNGRGGINLLTRASQTLAPYAERPADGTERPAHGVDVAGLRAWIAGRVAEAGDEAGPHLRVPRLRG